MSLGNVMLTTHDNPFDPFTEFEMWHKYDMLLGHDCCGLLDRTANTSDVFTDERNEELIDNALMEIVNREPLIYCLTRPKNKKVNNI